VNPAKFDTFISYDRRDKPLVEILARRLTAQGVAFWLDTNDLIPGEPWQPGIEKALGACDSCCILVGRDGLTGWQNEEKQLALTRRISTDNVFRVITVLLPGAGPRVREQVSRTFLNSTTWVEFEGSMEDEEALRRLVCGIRGIAPGPPPFDPTQTGEARLPRRAGAADLSWARSALASGADVRFFFGTLQSPASRWQGLCHYVVALIEKYSGLPRPTVAPAEQPYVEEARRVLIKSGWPRAAFVEPVAASEAPLGLLITADSNIPDSFPAPDFWIGPSPPAAPQEGTRFHLCDVNLALVCILLHCADESGRADELLTDLLDLPTNVRHDLLFMVILLWPEVVTSSYKFLGLPDVQQAAYVARNRLFPVGRDAGGRIVPPDNPALAGAIDALLRRDFTSAKARRKELGGRPPSGAYEEAALTFIDVSIAVAEGDDAAGERALREVFQRSADYETGCILALLLCWYGRHHEAHVVLQRLEGAATSAGQSALIKILGVWVAHHVAPHKGAGPQSAVEDLAGDVARSGEGQARLWHILSAACLDMGLIDLGIECAAKATRTDPRVLEYRVQHAAALLHRFPPTPPDYQRREPFPVRDREPRLAGQLLESALADSRQHDPRFVSTVQHLLGIAHYCAAVATPAQRERLQLFSQAGEAFSAARESSGPESFELASYAGQSFLRARDFPRACAAFESVPAESRSNSCENAYIVTLAMDGRVDDAISEVTRALEDGRLPAEAIANVATLVLQCGLPDDAKRLLGLAVTGLERQSWIVHFLLGRAHTDLKEFEDAEHELWTAISLNSTEPRLYSAHLLAFDQHTAAQARGLISEARRRAEGVRAETDFLSEFEQRVDGVVESYRRHVKGLNASATSASTVIAKSFEPVRRAVDWLRGVVATLGKLLRDPEVHDAEVFLATARPLLGAAPGDKAYAAELPAPSLPVLGSEPWIEFQRALSRDSSWSKAGLRLDDSGAAILAHIADASQQPVVPHWLHLAARQFDVEAHGRNLRAYAVTRGVERKPYQEAVVRRAKLRNYGRMILADEVGLGKTIEACLIFSEYRERGLVKACLVLVPSRELGQQWEQELTEKFGLCRERGGEVRRYRAAGWAGFDGHDVCILTYQAAVANRQAVLARHWDMVICDEAHHLTNPRSERFKLLKAMCKKAPYLLLLTATPIQRRVDDLYSLAQLVRPGMFPSLKEYRERYCDPRNPRAILRADDLARRMLEIMVRNRAGAVSSEVLLGRRRFRDLNVCLAGDEREFYEGVEALVFKAYKHSGSGKPPLAYYSLARAASSSPMAAAKWLESLAGEPSVSAEARRLLDFSRQLKPVSKLRELKTLLSLTHEQERVIVFTDYRSTARCVAESVGGILVDSNLTDRQLRARLEAFRDGGEGRILVATPRLSEGLNLQFCRNVVNFDLPWNPFKIEQRIGRVHRVGQRSPEVFISTLSASDTIEELIKEFLQSKLRMFEAVIGRMTHQVFEFESRGTIEDQIKDILARVESRKQLGRELAGVSIDQPILPHDPRLNRPPWAADILPVFDQALRRFSEPRHD
jgi:superfamily II DNA or RNA helicase/tetratricopeptide (TPR) repeat protein